VEIARRCNLTLVLGKPQLPNFPVPEGHAIESTSAMPRTRAWRAPGALFPTRPRARPSARYVERLEFELDTILKMGFPGYFLIVGDFINWAKKTAARWGRAAARARARWWPMRWHHRPGPAAVQPAVRALPEPRAGVDARLRHRLLPGQPRPRDRLREGQVRRDAVSQIATFGTMAAAPPSATWAACWT
jgi:DNA polymerase-3 subunit alpha